MDGNSKNKKHYNQYNYLEAVSHITTFLSYIFSKYLFHLNLNPTIFQFVIYFQTKHQKVVYYHKFPAFKYLFVYGQASIHFPHKVISLFIAAAAIFLAVFLHFNASKI